MTISFSPIARKIGVIFEKIRHQRAYLIFHMVLFFISN